MAHTMTLIQPFIEAAHDQIILGIAVVNNICNHREIASD